MMMWRGLDRKALGDLLMAWARKRRRREEEKVGRDTAPLDPPPVSAPPTPARREDQDV